MLLLAGLLSLPIYFLRDRMDTEEIRKQRYWIAKTHYAKPCAILFGGDSRTFRGISPHAFEEAFGDYQALNYAYWSNGMGRPYLEGMEKMLDPDAELRLIVLGITPHSLTPRAAHCSHFLMEQARTREEILQQYYLSGISEYFAPFTLLDLKKSITGKSTPNNYRITYHPDGWVESYWIRPDTSYSAQFYETIFTGNAVSQEVVETLLEFVRRWSQMGIHVAGFRPPTSHTIRSMEKELGGFDEEKFVSLFTAAGGIWIDVPNDAYQTFDGNHLEHESAKRLSADLGRQLRDQLLPQHPLQH